MRRGQRNTGSRFMLVGVTNVFPSGWNKTSSCFPLMVITLLAWSVTMRWWPGHSSALPTIMEVDWRTHFPWDLIINYHLCGNLEGFRFHGFQWPRRLIGGSLTAAAGSALSVSAVFHANSEWGLATSTDGASHLGQTIIHICCTQQWLHIVLCHSVTVCSPSVHLW